MAENKLGILLTFMILLVVGLSISRDINLTQETAYVQSDYCDGWENGYEEGWCYDQAYNCLTPLIPLCPLPKLYKETYQDGFNRGFVQGKEDYEND